MNEWTLPYSIDFRGREVRYGRQGEGPPVVLVHGTPWSSFNLRHLIADLARDHAVHYFDLLGYGASSKEPGDVSLGIQNEVLCALLDHWKLERPAVIGHDFGGATALRAHRLNGRAFERLVLIDPVAVGPWGSPFFRHVRDHEAAFAGVPPFIHDAIVRAYVTTAAHQPIDEAVMAGILEPWQGEAGQAAFYRQMAQADARYTDEVEPLYRTITTPTLILWGREDSWIPLARGEQLHAAIPGSRLEIIDDAGHLVIEEAPEKLTPPIRRFLAGADQ